jgi:hypothetical protein
VPFPWRSNALSINKKINTSLNSNVSTSKILKTVPFEKGFHFFTESMGYTGITATSIFEFEEKLKIVCAQSVEYHFRRHDFQKWISDTIGDVELATQIDRLNTQLSENLRKALLKILRKRIREVEKLHDSAV